MSETKFYIKKSNSIYTGEEDLFRDLKNHKREISRRRRISGFLRLNYDGVNCDIEDELAPLICNFCLEPISSLISGNNVKFLLFEIHGYVNMEVSEDCILISGDFFQEILVPKDEFMLSSFQCANRYLDFLNQLDDAQRNDDMVILHGAIEKAKSHLVEYFPGRDLK